MSCTWVVGAGILAVASFVFGLTGFGIGLVSLSLLPFFCASGNGRATYHALRSCLRARDDHTTAA